MDPRGYCRIEGRLKEMIIRGGENIYPREIEAVLLSHPAVTGVAVIGIPDRFWGEVVGAAISTSAAAQPTGAELAGSAGPGSPPARSRSAGCSPMPSS